MSVLVLGFQAVLLLVASRPDCSGHRSRPSGRGVRAAEAALFHRKFFTCATLSWNRS